MLNIVIPMAGNNRFDGEEFFYPKPFIEIAGKPMIEWVINCYADVPDKRFVFIVNRSDCVQFHLDRVLRLLTGHNTLVLPLDKPTQGAACSALLAIDHISPEEPLIICNGDQVIRHPIAPILDHFHARQVDAGLVCFDSIHPKWSYARVEDGQILETAEKCPISRHAIAGFYYFRRGGDFMRGACDSILKLSSTEGPFYIAPVLNELVLWGKRMETFEIPTSRYHHFYAPAKITEFEQAIKREETQ